MFIGRQTTTDNSVDFEDDGEYAVLRAGAVAGTTLTREDTVSSEENKVSHSYYCLQNTKLHVFVLWLLCHQR